MTHLLIDTTQKIFIGLLDENHKWIENKAIETAKSSSILHKEVYDLLRKYNTNIQSIKSLFYCSGPGSYTGMRVADGFAKVVEFSEIPYAQISRRHQNLCIICYILSRGFDEDFCNLLNSI